MITEKRLPEVNSARMADWANLQTDIVGTIIRKLAIPDYIRFRAVCTSWNRVCACRDVSNNPRVDPWLMLPTKMLEDAKFFSIPERKNETIRILSIATICGSAWTPVGSSNGWLVFFNPTLGTIQLVNPISSAQFQLPPVGCKLFSKAVLLDMSESNFSVAVIYGDQKGYKVTCKGSKGWSSVDSKHVLIDVFKHRSQLYTIDIYGTVELWAEPPSAWPDEDGLLVDPNLHHNFALDEDDPIWDQYVYDNWMEDQPDEDGPDEDGPDEDGLLLGPNLHHNFAPDEDDLMGGPYLHDNFELDEEGPLVYPNLHHNFGPDEDDPMGIPYLYDDLELVDPLVDPNQLNCLVETPAGDLMKVKRQSESKFVVWILNKGTSSFERTNDIGEFGLFVSRYSSFCLLAKDHPNVKSNHVYFIDSYMNLCAFNLEHGTKELVEALETLGAQNQQDMYLQGRPGVHSFLWFTPSLK
ncbi:hypothetical protein QYE76_050265 [Lolium multiflorum]|uniref:F-box protein n=1 Tax=Lolium multiflorum TaxID=4521 RepID=A0AAD8SRC9_LOLMU|nr:uncharacterized protein LOC124667085 isoform X2 [Lolium rigidum]XP_051223420.1 uncharacterized protein LOC127341599 isoform X2 [Lolium perenne]KAK1662106.1 hypothetical protein QYE76_050265 [Lolium multiflorum]